MARYFTSKHQFDTDAFRMFAALSRLCPSPASWYASGPVQKFLLRQIRIMDTTLLPRSSSTAQDHRRAGGGARESDQHLGEGAEDDDGDGDGDGALATEQATYPGKELDSTLLTVYGHVLFISSSFTYALSMSFAPFFRTLSSPARTFREMRFRRILLANLRCAHDKTSSSGRTASTRTTR